MNDAFKKRERLRLDQRIPNFQFVFCHFSFLTFFSVATALFNLRASLKKQSKNGVFRSLEKQKLNVIQNNRLVRSFGHQSPI